MDFISDGWMEDVDNLDSWPALTFLVLASNNLSEQIWKIYGQLLLLYSFHNLINIITIINEETTRGGKASCIAPLLRFWNDEAGVTTLTCGGVRHFHSVEWGKSTAPVVSVTQHLYLSLPLTHLCDLEKSHLNPQVSLSQFLQNRKMV